MAKVRAATEEDVPSILELYRQLSLKPRSYRKASISSCRRVFREMKNFTGYELLVAEEDSKVVGTTVMAILPGFVHGTSPFAVVEYVVVDEKYRGRGIGKSIMEYIIARAREAGCYKIMLTSDKRRQPAHRFYQSLGFEASAHGFRLYL
jgi:GNAT superfamily N-acetyltransferase